MTTATTEGRSLVLAVEGVDPFRVEPLPAKRGRRLTELFIDASVGQTTPAGAESIFIECIGPANYVRISGMYVDEYRAGKYLRTYDLDGSHQAPGKSETTSAPVYPTGAGEAVRFLAREPEGDEPELDGEPIRQEEAEALTLCAFYWQTIVGMEAVQAFLDGGEGSRGSLKALALLQLRLGLSRPETSPSLESVSRMQQGDTPDTNTPSGGVSSVRLPADRRSPLGLRLPSKGRRR